ncbi:fructose-bisphosphate aldolase [Escherichia marmotae]|uniref:Fructose-bisphosphate aldolase n=1 Tax=Escherichia marmotae TaxID=1499973 RepID=A0A7Z8ZQ03_9ESCH|nr:fructose-bisphosphate aldolase [Escherichia marmotae]
MTDIAQLLGKDADNLLQHRCMTIPSDQLYLPGHDYVDRVMIDNNRPPAVLRNMQTLYNTGRLAGTGYLSILPVDQGVEHSAGASFAANPLYFDPKNIVELAIEAAVTVWRQLMACWHRYRGVTLTAFHSSSNSTTTRR